MNLKGHVENGVVVLDEPARLPEGARVVVSVLPAGHEKPQIERQPGQLPLVRSAPGSSPGSVNLTNDRIAEIFEAEDIEAMKGQWDVPS